VLHTQYKMQRRPVLEILSLATFAFASAAQSALPAPRVAPPPPVVVDVLSTSPAAPPQDVLAVQVCAGLANRAAPQSAYVLLHDEDAQWLRLTRQDLPSPPVTTTVARFLSDCLGQSLATAAGMAAPVAAGRVRYNFAQQQLVVPQLLTLAAALNAVPLEDASPLAARATIVFDALAAWRNFSSLNATAFVFDRFGASTSSPAFMNPGLDVHGDPFSPNPPLNGQPDLALADFVVSARLMNFWMTSACIPGTDENALLERMVENSTWARPVAAFGYNDAWPIAGDIFEAETGCTRGHEMGQVATVSVTNLAYFSGAEPVTAPLQQAPEPRAAFNALRSYVSFIVGDGDNIAYIKSTRLQWFQDRIQRCGGANTSACYPLAWTISPRLQTAAPEIARWFFSQALSTGADFFVLPPSGHLYAYPASMPPAVQADFVSATEADAARYNTSASVAWEVLGTWAGAIASYFPQYAVRGVVRAFFALNVPYMVPIVEFAEGEFFKVLGGNESATPVILFKPFEWRGTDGSTLLAPFSLNATSMAALINGYAPGAVIPIYLTSDGGCNVDKCFGALAPLLAEHVEVVGPGALADLALQKSRAAGGTWK